MQRYSLVSLAVCLHLVFAPTSFVAAQEVAPDKRIKIGVASMVTPISAVKYYQAIIDYLAEKLGEPIEMVHRTTYDEIDRMLEENRLDAAFICSAPYVLDKKNFNVELLVAPVVNGEPFYQSYFIVHKSSPIETVEDLRHRTFAFVDPKSNTGRLYPVYLLAQKGTSPDDFFSRYIFSYSHNKSVELVAKKKVDGASVDSLVYQYMVETDSPYGRETRIIHQSPKFGIPPVVVPQNTPLFLKEKLRQEFVRLHESEKGRSILTGMHIEKFIEVPDQNYDLIRTMIDFVAVHNKGKTPRSAGENQEDGEPIVVRFGIIPDINPRIAYEWYQPLLDYLSDETGFSFELSLKKSFQEVVDGLGKGEIDVALLDPLSYLDAHAKYGITAIAKNKSRDGVPFVHSVIVSRKDSSFTDISQLTGKKFAFAALWSTAGNLYPRYMLAWEKIHLDKLASYRNFNYSDTVVKKVLSGEYDAGGVSQSIASKYLQSGLKILATSDPITSGPIAISQQVPYATVEKIKKALFSMIETKKGERVLTHLGDEYVGGFIPASDGDYSGIRKMMNDIPQGCGTGCHPKTHF